MKSKLPQVVLPLILAVASFGCQPKADSNSNVSVLSNKNSAPEPINTASIEAELIKLERDWSSAVKNHDAETVRRILADDVIITYPDGVVGTKAEEIHSVEISAITADAWDVLEPKVTVLSADSAFITGRAIIKNGKYRDPKAAKPVDISGEYRFLDVYAKRDGKWLAVASQTTRIANPAPAVSPAKPAP